MNTRVLVLGAGGHGQVVADILMQMAACGAPLCPMGFLDDNPALAGASVLGLPVLGQLAALTALEHEGVIAAVGNNRLRRRIFEQLISQGESIVTAIHPRAVVAPGVELGVGVVICAGAIVNPGSRIGANTILNTGCTVDHHNQIGAHAHVAPGAHLGGDVAISEGVLVGIGAVIMPQRRVGAWATVGAGAVVQRDVAAGVTVVGVPARPLSRRDTITTDSNQESW